MLHVLLLILKIIGITLLVILGLILLIILLVLFVPVRYSGDTRCKQDKTPETEENEAEESKKFDLYALAKITWLLHFVSFSFEYSDDLKYKLKVLGIPIMKSDKLKKDGETQLPEKENTLEAEKKEPEENPGSEDQGAYKPELDTENKPDNTESEGSGKDDSSDKTGKEAADSKEYASEKENINNINPEDKPEGKPDEKQNEKSDEKHTEKPDENHDLKEDKNGANGKKKKKIKKTGKKAQNGLNKNKENKEDAEEKQSVVEKIKNIYNKITALLDDRRVKRAYELVKVQLVRLIKAVVPRKIGGYAKYGFENPAITGYITAFLAAEYGRVRKLDIEPHFEDEILEGELNFKGRLYAITFVCIGCKVYFNKDIKYTIKKLKEFKESTPDNETANEISDSTKKNDTEA